MAEFGQHVLAEQAQRVSDYLHVHDIACTYRILEYGINFHVAHADGKHVLSLHYSPNNHRWKMQSVSPWIRETIMPLVQPLLSVEENASQPFSVARTPIPQ